MHYVSQKLQPFWCFHNYFVKCWNSKNNQTTAVFSRGQCNVGKSQQVFSKTSKRPQYFACELHFGCPWRFERLSPRENCSRLLVFEKVIEIQKTIKPLQFLFTCILMLANLNKFFSKTSKRPQFFACELHFGCQSTFQSLQVNKNCSGFIGFENVVASTIWNNSCFTIWIILKLLILILISNLIVYPCLGLLRWPRRY